MFDLVIIWNILHIDILHSAVFFESLMSLRLGVDRYNVFRQICHILMLMGRNVLYLLLWILMFFDKWIKSSECDRISFPFSFFVVLLKFILEISALWSWLGAIISFGVKLMNVYGTINIWLNNSKEKRRWMFYWFVL